MEVVLGQVLVLEHLRRQTMLLRLLLLLARQSFFSHILDLDRLVVECVCRGLNFAAVLVPLLLDKDVRVEHFVVEIVELHRAALERMLLVRALFLLGGPRRHQNALLEEVSGRDHRVGIELPVLFDFADAHLLGLRVGLRAYIGVPGAHIDHVASFLAAEAADVLDLLGFAMLLVFLLFLFLLRLVLRVLAA